MGTAQPAYNDWRNKYLRSYQDGFYVYYKEAKENVPEMTCSEAHGYGMLASVLMRNQADFDGMYRYFMRFRNQKGLMQWQQKNGRGGEFVPGDEGGMNCATDGDVDVATALFLAKRVWGRGGQQGEIDYGQSATELAGCIWQHCINHSTYMPLVGDWADPGDDAYKLTRPSDFILSGYLVFHQEDTARQQQWAQVINAIVSTTQAQLSLNPQTGLIADFLKLDHNNVYSPARGEVLESKHDGDYNWNSCQTEAHFFAGQLAQGRGECGVKAGYRLNGHCIADYTDMAFVAPVSFLFWVLGWHTQLGQILQDMNGMASDNTYFGESIALLCLLQANVVY
ncbi:Six-hairpin glycosidase-like protein [Absidia repens]|uniref:Six-hairpin glycosidase-like protein n=1 Tax=Absidia repens TaxID=90262 RepID=A0A1X2IZT8_9FUNG|nr:Six-hairpin glycosidase-like protein [Absidia repens]